MAVHELIRGAEPNVDNLTYWDHNKVTIQKDPTGANVFEIAPGGFMSQNISIVVEDNTFFNVIYKMPSTYDAASTRLQIEYSDDTRNTSMIFLNGSGNDNRWQELESVLEKAKDNKVSTLCSVYISNTTNKPIQIRFIEWNFSDSSASADGIDPIEYIRKAFLYGLDKDKPVLGTDGDKYDRR